MTSVNALAAPASNLVGWGLPTYLSMKAIETPSRRDDGQWLTYWVIFGFLTYIESFAHRIVRYYLSWYFAAKSIFVIWLQLPQTQGAATFYRTAIRPSMARARVQASSPTTRYPATTNTQTAPAGYSARTAPAGCSVDAEKVY